MTRCDYDALFYRVFCVTLLAIAFTFTIILTNVFIDIDGLLTTNRHDKHHSNPRGKAEHDFVREELPTNDDNISYGENDDSYRTKRSIETQNFLFHIKNPKIKNILTNRLSSLLEELDADIAITPKDEATDVKEIRDGIIIAEDIKGKEEQEEKIKKQLDEDVLHLTMHNILLQGIIGHMDMNQVYKRVNKFMQNFKAKEDQKAEKLDEKFAPIIPLIEKANVPLKTPLEDQFTKELTKCSRLQNQIISEASKNPGKLSTLGAIRFDPKLFLKPAPDKMKMKSPSTTTAQPVPDVAINTKLGPNVLIKTVIDIKSIGGEKSETISKENIHGIIELIYNGKLMRFTRPDREQGNQLKTAPLDFIQPKNEKLAKRRTTANTINVIPITSSTQVPLIDINALKKIPKDYLNRFVTEYFKHFPTDNQNNVEELKEKETKRLKRHVKIKYENDNGRSHLSKQELKKKKEDDELYVEIETHFDSRGLKGEKKRKLIRNLIEKIQKAIHSDDSKKVPKRKSVIQKKKTQQLHVRKRLQNPLEHSEHILVNKFAIPLTSVQRQINPITIKKLSPAQDIKDRSGEAWKREYIGPTFFAGTKSINSAEMSELDIDYNKVLDVNGIPQRLQMPLNTELSEEAMNPNTFYDLGNMKFFIKDIDGTGFAIGFNQYVDEPPDPETIKLFTGLENVIKTYHQSPVIINDPPQEHGPNYVNLENEEKTDTTDKNDHLIVRRSIDHQNDYHSNEYKVIFDGEFLPYKEYSDIYSRKTTAKKFSAARQFQDMPLVVDENIFDKNLKPSEIFGLASLFQRKKRSLNVKKISNLKTKIKMNRYLNTKTMANKRIFLNNKRHKRQINKIRIIASDVPHRHSSDENLYVVSGDHIFADRATIKDMEVSEPEPDKEEDILPYHTEETYRIYDEKFAPNSLMDKYPHVFMEDVPRSREELIPDKFSARFGQIIDDIETPTDGGVAQDKNNDKNVEVSGKMDKVSEMLVDALIPKPAYKVTVKITPKNSSSLDTDFKEIHTSINKSYNKNGLLYSSLVNVSEISKVMKINKTHPNQIDYKGDAYLSKKIRDQQEKMQTLLRQHQKHIDEQLTKLNEEKSTIDAILVDDNNTVVPHLDYLDTAAARSHKVLHLSKDEVNKLAAAAAINKEPISTTTPIIITTTTSTTTTTSATTTMTTTTTTTTPKPVTTSITTPPPIINETLKKNILNTMERNEHLTDQILKKIDKNTEMLQTFLKKLTEKIQHEPLTHPMRTAPEEIIPKEEKQEKKTEITQLQIPKFEINNAFNPIDWRNPATFNNMILKKNESHISIPFVYAYQQPLAPHKSNTPVTSVVYHGHIHTNAVHAKDVSAEKSRVQPMLKMFEPTNRTRFFLDDISNDYKVIPVSHAKKIILHKGSNMTMV